jgi:hypothetical protein
MYRKKITQIQYIFFYKHDLITPKISLCYQNIPGGKGEKRGTLCCKRLLPPKVFRGYP